MLILQHMLRAELMQQRMQQDCLGCYSCLQVCCGLLKMPWVATADSAACPIVSAAASAGDCSPMQSSRVALTAELACNFWGCLIFLSPAAP